MVFKRTSLAIVGVRIVFSGLGAISLQGLMLRAGLCVLIAIKGSDARGVGL